MLKITVDTADFHRQLQELQAGFTQIPQKLAKKYLKAAARDGAREMLNPLKSITPKRSGKGKGQGNLRRSIKTAAKFYQKGAEAGAVGVIFYSRKNNLGNHSWLLESGTKERYVTSRNKKTLLTPAYRGKGPAIHMMSRTRISYASKVKATVEKRTVEALQDAIRDTIKPRY